MNSATVPAGSEAGTTRMCGASATLNTGARSFIGSNGSACSRNGLTTRLPPAQIISVWPSAGERTTKSIATLPEAPGLFSTTTGWPSFCASPSADRRPRRSVIPPGEVSTMSRIARVGYALWARANVAKKLKRNASATGGMRRVCIFLLRWLIPSLSGNADRIPEDGRSSNRIRLALGPHLDFHLADFLDAALQVIAVGELRHARRRAGRDEDSGPERRHAREKADVLAQSADHVAGMRAHRGLAVLLDADREVLRIVDLVARDDPGPQARESIEALADVARVLPAAAPGIALAEVPANGVAENVIESLLLADMARGLSDHRAELAFEIHVFRNLRKDDGAARADEGRGGLEEELRHQLVLAQGRAVGRAHFFAHLRLVRLVVRRRGPDGRRIENRREQLHGRQRCRRAGLRGETRALHRGGLVREHRDHFEHRVAGLQMAGLDERFAERMNPVCDHRSHLVFVVVADFHSTVSRGSIELHARSLDHLLPGAIVRANPVGERLLRSADRLDAGN